MKQTRPPAKPPPGEERPSFLRTQKRLAVPQDDDLSPTMNSYRIAARTGGAKGDHSMKWKKLASLALAGALTLGLLPALSAPALAADNVSTYTLQIPSTLTVSAAGWNETSGLTAAVTSGDTFDSGKKLSVTATSTNSWSLVSGSNSVGYNLATATGAYSSTATPASWEFSAAELNASGGTKKDMGIIVEDYSSKPAGTYQDTVTFTAAVENAGIPVTSVTINNAPTEALFVNSTGTLTATVLPNDATDKTVTWSSSDSDYVSINAETGEYEVKGTKGYGSATITATATNGTEDTSDDVTATCTITGKVTYTSLKAGDVLHVGDTFYVGQVYFNTTPSMSFNNSNGVITLVENDATGTLCYKFKRGSNGTMPNVTAYKVKDNTDGVYIVSGSGTSTSDKFTLAVHTTN